MKSAPKLAYHAKDTLTAHIAVANLGNMDADEVVQAYIVYPNLERMPIKELKYFTKAYISKGTSQNVKMRIPIAELKKWDLSKNDWTLYPGTYKLVIGSNAQDEKLSSSFEIQ